jgi:hypothetical protein
MTRYTENAGARRTFVRNADHTSKWIASGIANGCTQDSFFGSTTHEISCRSVLIPCQQKLPFGASFLN